MMWLNGLELSASVRIRQEGDELVLNPGDLFILDAVRPFELGCEGGVTQISLKVPRQILWERMRHPEGARAASIPGTSHIGKLLSGYIMTLWQRGETEQKTRDPSAMDHLFSLVAYEVDRRHGDAALPRRAVRAGIYACAVSYIGEAHGMPELTPRSVAHVVGTSLRTLQNIFAERQDAISRHIQNRRITTVARWLAEDRRCASSVQIDHRPHEPVRCWRLPVFLLLWDLEGPQKQRRPRARWLP